MATLTATTATTAAVSPSDASSSITKSLDPSPRSDFYWVETDEPHATRRALILAKYPQIKRLFGVCSLTKYMVSAVVALQVLLAVAVVPKLSWPAFLAVTYVVGATCNHALLLAIHELTHNLGFARLLPNRVCAFVANLPIGVPMVISFKRYHSEHHRYQGVEGVDVDLPTQLEGVVFKHWLAKLLFVMFQGVFYALRPAFVNPKTPGKWEAINWSVELAFDGLIYLVGGPSALLYLLLSTLLGMGLHPTAGHFISEHYVFTPGVETYSYYGPLNYVTFNVGYHVEHHDFPYIPWSRLPLVRAIAPEFYATLPTHDSYVRVLWQYITNPSIGAFSRVKRRRRQEHVLVS